MQCVAELNCSAVKQRPLGRLYLCSVSKPFKCTYICLNCKKYLSKFLNVFVPMIKCIGSVSVLWWSSGHWAGFISALYQNHSNVHIFVWIVKSICSNFKMYLSKLQNVFVPIIKCIGSAVKQRPLGRFYLCSASKSFIRGRSAATHLGFEG